MYTGGAITLGCVNIDGSKLLRPKFVVLRCCADVFVLAMLACLG